MLQEIVHNVEPELRKRLLSVPRKLLQVGTGSLDLSGSGVSAGDSVVGASAEAYGHGVLDAESLQDNHIEVSFQYKTLEHWSLQLRIQPCAYRPPLLRNAMSSSFEPNQDFVIYVYACCKQAYTVNSD